MKKLVVLLMTAVGLLGLIPALSAQSVPPGNACIVRDTGPESEMYQIALVFRRLTDNLNIPYIPDLSLNCSSDPSAVAAVNVSPSVPLNTIAPRPKNPIGLAESQEGYAIVDTGAANLRSGPGPQFTRVAIVDGGTRLVVLGHNPAETWWYVQAGDIRGWIWEDLLILRGDLTEVPIVINEGELRTPTLYVGYPGNVIYDTVDGNGQVICAAIGRAEFPLVGQSANSNWYLIDATCQDGTVVRGWIWNEAGIVREVAGVPIPVIP